MKRAVWEHYEALGGIAALLLAMAALAERAARRGRPVRRLVLWLLRQAETTAREFAVEAAGSPLVPVECTAPEPGDAPADAVDLAGRFRALAAVFFALAHRALRLAWGARPPDIDSRRHGRPDGAWLDRLLVAPRPRSADTS